MAEQYKMDLPERFLEEQYADDYFSPYSDQYMGDMDDMEKSVTNLTGRKINPIELAAIQHLFSGGKVMPQSVVDAYNELPFGENYYDSMSPVSFSVSPDGNLIASEGDKYSFYENLGLPVPSPAQDKGFGGLLDFLQELRGKKTSAPQAEDYMNEAGY
tara:strand:+ start:6932 stop:7405 length:474 start_codon:yes stop_codon:yes gene_type:complete